MNDEPKLPSSPSPEGHEVYDESGFAIAAMLPRAPAPSPAGETASEGNKPCFNCGCESIGKSLKGKGLPLCRTHFDMAIVAGWEPQLYAELGGAVPEPVPTEGAAEDCPARGAQLKHADRPELETGVPLTHCACWWDAGVCCNCGDTGEEPVPTEGPKVIHVPRIPGTVNTPVGPMIPKLEQSSNRKEPRMTETVKDFRDRKIQELLPKTYMEIGEMALEQLLPVFADYQRLEQQAVANELGSQMQGERYGR